MTEAHTTRPLASSGVAPRVVLRAAVWNQLLWTAGASLTGGAFLLYFAAGLGAKDFRVSLLLALPELVGVGALATRPLVAMTHRRKRVWGVAGVLARVVSLGIPLMAFPALRPTSVHPLTVLTLALGVSQVLQAISYVAYLSWLSDLAPETQWGRFFAARSLARIGIQCVVPVAVGFARDRWVRGLPPDAALVAFVATFALGTLLALCSMLPLLRLPDVPRPAAANNDRPSPEYTAADFKKDDLAPQDSAPPDIAASMGWSVRGFSGSLWLLILQNAWLAFANGLTQAAFFSYRTKVLGVSLGTYYLLENTTLAVMVPVSLWAGRVSDRRGNKRLLFWGGLAAACAMPFWFAATPERWWLLFGAQVAWGAFAAVNLAGHNLLLKLSPRGGNTLQLALFQQGGGLMAGISGLLGGLWLQELTSTHSTFALGAVALGAHQVVFLASAAGRFLAPLWLLPLREPPIDPPSAVGTMTQQNS